MLTGSIHWRPCNECGNSIPFRVMVTSLSLAPVEVGVCNLCDRRRCQQCDPTKRTRGLPVRDPRAKRCASGHHLFGT